MFLKLITRPLQILPFNGHYARKITIRTVSSASAQPSQRAQQQSQRGGQNLTERYVRLEKSLRGKEALEAKYGDLQRSTLSGPKDAMSLSAGKAVDIFRGIVIPEKPREPQSDGAYTFFFLLVSR